MKPFVTKYIGSSWGDIDKDLNQITRLWKYSLSDVSETNDTTLTIMFEEEEDHTVFVLKFGNKHGLP